MRLAVHPEEWETASDRDGVASGNAVLVDLYGERTLLRDGILPAAAVLAQPGFARTMAYSSRDDPDDAPDAGSRTRSLDRSDVAARGPGVRLRLGGPGSRGLLEELVRAVRVPLLVRLRPVVVGLDVLLLRVRAPT